MAADRVMISDVVDKVAYDLLAEAGIEAVKAATPTREAFLELAPGCTGFIIRSGDCTREIISAAPGLKVIGKHGVGVDNIDIPFASERGIPVFNTPTANSEAVAEMALMLMLGVARRSWLGHELTKTNRFREGRVLLQSLELQGKTLGIVGLGHIGRLVAQKCAAAFAMRVLAYDPYVTKPPAVSGGSLEMVQSVDDLAREADFITLHIPLTPETEGIIGPAQFALMKLTAILVNASRGAVVDEPALIETLRTKRIWGAGLDAFVDEPIKPDSPLLEMDNVLLSPHVGGQTHEALRAMARDVASGVIAALRGERPPAVLNPEVYEQRGEQ